MGIMDKLLSSMKYDEDYEDDEEFLDDEEEEVSSRKKPIKTATMDDGEDTKKARTTASAFSGPRKGSNRTMSNGMEVCVIKPTTVEDAREITETLLDNRTVVLNMEGLDMDIAQRIIDFTSGSTFAIGGNLQKISHYIFIVTPRTVEISGDFQEILSGSFDVPALRNKF